MMSDSEVGQHRPEVPFGGPARRRPHTAKGEAEQAATQVLYVAATRSTQ